MCRLHAGAPLRRDPVAFWVARWWRWRGAGVQLVELPRSCRTAYTAVELTECVRMAHQKTLYYFRQNPWNIPVESGGD